MTLAALYEALLFIIKTKACTFVEMMTALLLRGRRDDEAVFVIGNSEQAVHILVLVG